MAGHAKAKTERCPSWRQLYRLTATLCEAAGIEAPHTAADASALIERLDVLVGGETEPVAVAVVKAGDDCPF
jgi:hypothetical protein